MQRPKLILLNGFAASGKTTIARKYIQEHDMAFAIEADTLVDNIGNWLQHIEETRQLGFELTKAMVRAYLPSGHDVVLPYLVTDAKEVAAFELIAHECDADYYEAALYNNRPDAIARLLKRGRWGEASSPPLTDKDMPVIEAMLTRMETALKQRPAAKKLFLKDTSPETTYQQLLDYIQS